MKKNKNLLILLFALNFNIINCADKNWLTNLWHYITNHAPQIENDLKTILVDKYNATNPYRNTQAAVRVDSSLASQEINVINKRLVFNKAAQEKLLGVNLNDNQTLKIAFCASGGGYRAMICTLGFLIGAQEIGLLDCTLYTSTLSGSTWAVGPWTQLQTDLTNLKNIISKNLATNDKIANEGLMLPHISDVNQIEAVTNNFLTKIVFNQKVSSVDLWGSFNYQ